MDIIMLLDDIQTTDITVEALEVDYKNRPLYVLNPILDITFSVNRCDGGDYERVVLDKNLLWHWEHNEHYPEYYVAQHWRDNYPECLDWWHSGPPSDYQGWISDECPIYGKGVNSLCWYKHYRSFFRLLADNRIYAEKIITEGTIFINGQKIVSYELKAFVNKELKLFSPCKTICCETLSRPERKRKGYKHWLNIGIEESNPLIKVYYPLNANKDIRVLTSYKGKDKYFNWNHGRLGLFSEIYSYYCDKTSLLEFCSDEFKKGVFQICIDVEKRYR